MSIPNRHFEESYDRLFGNLGLGECHSNRFFASFYHRFTQDPLVSTMFSSTDDQKQIHMLKRSVFDLAGFYVTGIPSAELNRLATLHKQLNVQAELLDLWLMALLDTVQQFDPLSNELVQAGWTCAMLPGITLIRLKLME